VTVVLSDYRSTQIALSTPEGRTQSESLISSASVPTDGLSFALSGDVVLPKTRPRSGRVVLLDRFGTNVVTWVDPTSARVLAQLPVGTGFQSNPQDYIEIDDRRAYISRFGHNLLSGQEALDEGSDVLIVDTLGPAILGRIALPSSPAFPPRPGGFLALDTETILLILGRLSLDLQSADTAMLVALDVRTSDVAWQFELAGLKNCGTPRLSPDRERVAIACSGPITRDGASQEVGASGVIVLDVRSRPPTELARFPAAAIAEGPLQSDLAFSGNDRVLVKSQTAVGATAGNALLELRLTTGERQTRFEVAPEASDLGLALGSMLCAPDCASHCLVANSADAAIVRLRRHDDGAVEYTDELRVERRVGLPPVQLGYR
jgi:hypothetical protein